MKNHSRTKYDVVDISYDDDHLRGFNDDELMGFEDINDSKHSGGSEAIIEEKTETLSSRTHMVTFSSVSIVFSGITVLYSLTMLFSRLRKRQKLENKSDVSILPSSNFGDVNQHAGGKNMESDKERHIPYWHKETPLYGSEESYPSNTSILSNRHQNKNSRIKELQYKSDRNNMVLTELHRVSSGVDLESLIEISIPSVSRTTASELKLPSSCTFPTIPVDINGADMGKNISGGESVVMSLSQCEHDMEIDDYERSDHDESSSNYQRCNIETSRVEISDFDAVCQQTLEVMVDEDSIINQIDDECSEVNIPTVVKRQEILTTIEECDERKGKEPAENATLQANFPRDIDSLENKSEKGADESELTMPALLLDEGSLAEVARRNGYTRLDSLHGADRVEDDTSNSIVDDCDVYEGCGHADIDLIHRASSSSSSSLGVSTMASF